MGRTKENGHRQRLEQSQHEELQPQKKPQENLPLWPQESSSREEQGRFCGGSFTLPPWMCKKHEEHKEPIQRVFSEIIAAANCQIIIMKHLEVC